MIKEKIRRHQVGFALSTTYIQTISKILKLSKTSIPAWVKAVVLKEIRRLSSEYLGLDIEVTDYERLYNHWLATCALRSNKSGPKCQIKPEVIHEALQRYSEETIIQAIDTYADILHRPGLYAWCPVVYFEEFLSNDIEGFLLGVDPSPYVLYARPDNTEAEPIIPEDDASA